LLYELLTGTTPFDADKLRSAAYDEMLKTIREAEPPKPSTRLNTLGDALTNVAKHRHAEPSELCKLLRGDFDWVAMKTLEKDRTRRYETANELAMDIERHLRDEPVVAGPPSAAYRLRKFIRRNRRAVSVGLLVVAALLIGFSLAVIGFVREGRARARAEEQRERAEANFYIARDAVDEMTRVAEEELVGLGGSEQVRRDLLQKAQVFYASFAQKNRDDEVVREEIALALYRVGIIHIELFNFFKAREALRQAVSLLETLTVEFPDVPEYRLRLRDSLSKYGYTFIWTHDQEEMLRVRTKELTLVQELVSDFPRVAEYRERLAVVHTGLGITLEMVGMDNRLKEAEMHLRQGLAVWQQLYFDFPDEPKNLGVLAHAHHWLGAHLLKTDDLEEAEEHLRKTLELYEQLLAEDPNDPWRRGRLAHIKSYVGELLTKQGKAEEAEREFREAIAIREKLIEEFPAQIEHRRRLGSLLWHLSTALMRGGHKQEAEDALRRSIAIRKKLAIDFPDVAGFRDDLAERLIRLSEMLAEGDRLVEALESCREGLGMYEKLVSDFPDVRLYKVRLAKSYNQLGDLLKAARKLEEAEQAYQKAEEIEKQVEE
jgi:tetratricopeptide (TPR) repeat protein